MGTASHTTASIDALDHVQRHHAAAASEATTQQAGLLLNLLRAWRTIERIVQTDPTHDPTQDDVETLNHVAGEANHALEEADTFSASILNTEQRAQFNACLTAARDREDRSSRFICLVRDLQNASQVPDFVHETVKDRELAVSRLKRLLIDADMVGLKFPHRALASGREALELRAEYTQLQRELSSASHTAAADINRASLADVIQKVRAPPFCAPAYMTAAAQTKLNASADYHQVISDIQRAKALNDLSVETWSALEQEGRRVELPDLSMRDIGSKLADARERVMVISALESAMQPAVAAIDREDLERALNSASIITYLAIPSELLGKARKALQMHDRCILALGNLHKLLDQPRDELDFEELHMALAFAAEDHIPALDVKLGRLKMVMLLSFEKMHRCELQGAIDDVKVELDLLHRQIDGKPNPSWRISLRKSKEISSVLLGEAALVIESKAKFDAQLAYLKDGDDLHPLPTATTYAAHLRSYL